MNILKPQKILFDKMIKIEDLLGSIKENEINNIILDNYKKENIKTNDITIERAILNNFSNREHLILTSQFWKKIDFWEVANYNILEIRITDIKKLRY